MSTLTDFNQVTQVTGEDIEALQSLFNYTGGHWLDNKANKIATGAELLIEEFEVYKGANASPNEFTLLCCVATEMYWEDFLFNKLYVWNNYNKWIKEKWDDRREWNLKTGKDLEIEKKEQDAEKKVYCLPWTNLEQYALGKRSNNLKGKSTRLKNNAYTWLIKKKLKRLAKKSDMYEFDGDLFPSIGRLEE